MQRLREDEKTPTTLCVKLPKAINEWLSEHCKFAGQSKSQFIRELLEDLQNEELEQ